MKVLHFSKHFSETSETFIYDYVTELEESGVENYVVTLNRHNEEQRPFPRVTVVKAPGRWDARRLWYRILASFGIGHVRSSYWPLIRKQLRRVVEVVRPDVIHAQFGPAGAIIAPVARRTGVPLMTHFHGYDLFRLLPSNFWEGQYHSLFDTAARLIGVSNHICDKLKNVGAPAEKIQLLHGGVRVGRFPFIPPRPRFDGRTVQCLHVGRLMGKKAPLALVHAFSYALGHIGAQVELRLKIAGDGPLMPALTDLIATLGMGSKVQCLGSVSHERVVELMQESHLYTQHCKTAKNGDQEGQGITFVEASATGLPIVTTRHNGIPDVVDHGHTGFLVPEGDTQAMGERIAYLATHPDEWPAFSEAGRQRVEERFDLSTQTKKLISIYENVLAQT